MCTTYCSGQLMCLEGSHLLITTTYVVQAPSSKTLYIYIYIYFFKVTTLVFGPRVAITAHHNIHTLGPTKS